MEKSVIPALFFTHESCIFLPFKVFRARLYCSCKRSELHILLYVAVNVLFTNQCTDSPANLVPIKPCCYYVVLMLELIFSLTCGSEAESQGGVEESGLQLARNNQPGKAQVQPRLEGEEGIN